VYLSIDEKDVKDFSLCYYRKDHSSLLSLSTSWLDVYIGSRLIMGMASFLR